MTGARLRPGPGGRDLVASLVVSGVLVLCALAGLSLQGNWSKAARVLLAWLTYGAVLLGLLRARQASIVSGDRVPYWLFGLAGAGAGIVSGFMQPGRSTGLVAVSGLMTAALVGGLHYAVVREWRRVVARIAGQAGRAGSD